MFLIRQRSTFCLLAITCGISAWAADLCVTVTDYADLPLWDARIQVTSLVRPGQVADQEIYVQSTAKNGEACVRVPEGMYAVEAGLTGFVTVRYYPISVHPEHSTNLSFRLPLGETTEGGVGAQALLAGTLQIFGSPALGTTICLLKESSDDIVTCGKSDGLGEYAIWVRPGKYRVEVKTGQGQSFRSSISVEQPGTYRNKIAIGRSTIDEPPR